MKFKQCPASLYQFSAEAIYNSLNEKSFYLQTCNTVENLSFKDPQSNEFPLEKQVNFIVVAALVADFKLNMADICVNDKTRYIEPVSDQFDHVTNNTARFATHKPIYENKCPVCPYSSCFLTYK